MADSATHSTFSIYNPLHWLQWLWARLSSITSKQWAHIAAFLAAIGVGLQGISSVAAIALALGATSIVAWSIGIAVGFCAGAFVNWLFNASLIPDLEKRMQQKNGLKGIWENYKKLSTHKKFLYAIGAFATFLTSLMLTAVAVMLGLEAALSPLIVAMVVGCGVFVAIITSLTEFETLFGYLEEEHTQKVDRYLSQTQQGKHQALKYVGRLVALTNALSFGVLFAACLYGLFGLFGFVGAPALILSMSLAVFGSITEGIFYWKRLSVISVKMEEEIQAGHFSMISAANLAIFANAAVNFAIHLGGVTAFFELTAALGLFSPAGWLATLISITFATCAGSASYLLGSTFWIDSGKKLVEEAKTLVNNTLGLGQSDYQPLDSKPKPGKSFSEVVKDDPSVATSENTVTSIATGEHGEPILAGNDVASSNHHPVGAGLVSSSGPVCLPLSV